MSSTVAIIGGGPAGVAAARALLAESPEFTITIFESRPAFGGLWNYSPTKGPMYRDLVANVSRELIGFHEFAFPGQGILKSYPSRDTVLGYIRDYSRSVTRDTRVSVQFNTEVESVVKDEESGSWITATSKSQQFRSDFLVLATGHYEFPNWPSIQGLRSHPGVIHSVDYDSPDEFIGKRVLILGNSRSGTDIAIQVLGATAPIAISRRRVGPADKLFDNDPGSVDWKPEVVKVAGRLVFFKDGSSETFDRVIACTGYLYDFPYVKHKNWALPLLDQRRVRFHNLYKHTFYIGDPSLATLGMNKGMVPFPTFETQAEVIAHVWANKLRLPSMADMLQEEESQRLLANAEEEKYHDLSMNLDIAFMQTLWNWADKARGGFRAERWNENKIELRKAAAEQKGKEDMRNLLQSRARRDAAALSQVDANCQLEASPSAKSMQCVP